MYSNFYLFKKFQDQKKNTLKNWYGILMYNLNTCKLVNSFTCIILYHLKYLTTQKIIFEAISHQDQTQSAVDKTNNKSLFGVAFISKSSVLSLCTKKLKTTKHILCPWFECVHHFHKSVPIQT